MILKNVKSAIIVPLDGPSSWTHHAAELEKNTRSNHKQTEKHQDKQKKEDEVKNVIECWFLTFYIEYTLLYFLSLSWKPKMMLPIEPFIQKKTL